MNTFDLLGKAPKKPTSLDLLKGIQSVVDKTEKLVKLQNNSDALYKDVQNLRNEIVSEGQQIMSMVGHHDPTLEPGLMNMLPSDLTVPELLRFAQLHETLATQGFTVRLLRDSNPIEHNWVAWGDSPIKGMVAVQVITYTRKDKRLSRICLDILGEAVQTEGTSFLSIRLHEMDTKNLDPLILKEKKQLINFTSEKSDIRQTTNLRHEGIRLVLPSDKALDKMPASFEQKFSIPAKLVFLLVKSDPKQIQREIESALCEPLDHLTQRL